VDLKESAMRKISVVSLVLLLVATNAFAVCNLDILDESIPDGFLSEPYSYQMSACCGTPGYTWSIWSGSLPPGLSLSSTGLISGTPTTVGYWLVYIRVTDSTGCTLTRAYFIYVN
jgi:hypothetical protein